MASKVSNPHDLLVKLTLRRPKAMREFIMTYVAPALKKRIDPDTISLPTTTYVSDRLKEILQDLIFTCQIDNKITYCYILLEHQSTPDWLLPLRFIKANIGIIEEYLQNKKDDTPWPIIYNICLYHSPKQKPYPYSAKVYDYFQDRHLAKTLDAFSKFDMVNLGQKEDKWLDKHEYIGLMEKLLKYSRDEKFFEVLSKELDRVGDQLFGVGKDAHPLGKDYWQVVLVYAISMIDAHCNSEQEVVNLFIEKLTKPKGEVMGTIYQQIEQRIIPEIERRVSKKVRQECTQEGRQEGRKEGRQEGRKEGRQEGKKEGRQEGRKEGRQKGRQEGRKEEKKVIAQNMLSSGLGVALIAQVTGLSKQSIAKLG